jgi:hypothetical protein
MSWDISKAATAVAVLRQSKWFRGPPAAFDGDGASFHGARHRRKLQQLRLEDVDSGHEWMLLLERKTAQEKVASLNNACQS